MSTQQKRCRSPLEATTARSCGWKRTTCRSKALRWSALASRTAAVCWNSCVRAEFDVVILCSQLEDMSGLEFLMNIRSMDPKPNVVLFDEGRRQNTSAICLESGDGFCYVGHAELKNLLWELYRLPGRQSQRMERKCQELYEGWGIQLPDVNCNYLSCAVGVVYGTSQKLAIRKEILQAVSEQYDVSVSAVDSGIRRMIDQLEAKPSAKWLRFKDESGFADEKPTTGKLIYTVKNYLQRQKDD